MTNEATSYEILWRCPYCGKENSIGTIHCLCGAERRGEQAIKCGRYGTSRMDATEITRRNQPEQSSHPASGV